MLHDDIIHGAWAGARRVRRIAAEMPVLPHEIAARVVEEASVWLNEPLPDAWARELAAKADLVFTHKERFRRRIAARGDQGRDRLWAFMRHRPAALLYDQRPDCLARLPQSYRVGTAPDTR